MSSERGGSWLLGMAGGRWRRSQRGRRAWEAKFGWGFMAFGRSSGCMIVERWRCGAGWVFMSFCILAYNALFVMGRTGRTCFLLPPLPVTTVKCRLKNNPDPFALHVQVCLDENSCAEGKCCTVFVIIFFFFARKTYRYDMSEVDKARQRKRQGTKHEPPLRPFLLYFSSCSFSPQYFWWAP